MALVHVAQHHDEISFDAYELFERVDDSGRRHRARIVTAHRQIPIAGHVPGRRRQVTRDATEFRGEPDVGIQFPAGVFIGDVERLLVHLEVLGHCGGKRAEGGHDRRMLGEPFSARLLIAFAHARHDTPITDRQQPRRPCAGKPRVV